MVGSIVKSFNCFSLLYLDLRADFHKVLQENILLEDPCNFRVLLEYAEPIVLADGVTLEFSPRIVDEGGPLVEGTSICADYNHVCILYAVSLLLVYFVSNQHLPLGYKHNLLKFIKFVNYDAFLCIHWLKLLEELDHKVSVDLIIPGIEAFIHSALEWGV